MMRIGLVLSTAALLIVVIASCGSSEDPASVPVGTGGFDGGTLVEGGTLNGLSVVNPACGTGDGGTEDQECDDCVEANCTTHLVACFGDNWETTLDSGPCQAFGQCVMACPCGDGSCFQACVKLAEAAADSPCLSCLINLFECEKASCAAECVEERDAGVDSGRTDAGGGRDN